MKTMLVLCAILILMVGGGCATGSSRLAITSSPEAETLTPLDLPDMSLADRFLYHRPFPFCQSESGDPSAEYPGMDYIVLPAVGGDEGLAAAMALFWNAESIELTPTGETVTPPIDSFQHVYTSPLPDQSGISNYVAIWGGIQEDDMDAGAVAPKRRICSGSNSLTDKTVVFFGETSYARTFPLGELGQVLLLVRYVSGEWRLYYRLSFITGAANAIQICNPEYAVVNIDPMTYTLDSSGTISVFGHTLDWEAWYESTYTVANLGLTATSVSFTYPSP